jgi:hypothetical protein
MITISGDGGLYHSPTVYHSTVDDLAEWADYSRASGSCPNYHEWNVCDGGVLYAESPDSFDTPSVTGQARVPDDDRDRAYIACPDCARPLHFTA